MVSCLFEKALFYNGKTRNIAPCKYYIKHLAMNREVVDEHKKKSDSH